MTLTINKVKLQFKNHYPTKNRVKITTQLKKSSLYCHQQNITLLPDCYITLFMMLIKHTIVPVNHTY